MAIQSIGDGNLYQPSPLTQTHPKASDSTATTQVSATPLEKASASQNDNAQQESLHQAVQKLNDFVSGASQNVVFSIDKDTDISVIKVVDRQTNDVIRQIPSVEAIQIAKVLDKFQGLLVREKA